LELLQWEFLQQGPRDIPVTQQTASKHFCRVIIRHSCSMFITNW